MKKAWLTTKKSGFSLIEVVLAGSIFSLMVTIYIGAYLYGLESTALAGNRARAASIAEEGLEAVRNIRDADFALLGDGTYGLAVASNEWAFSGSSDVTDIFTREVVISTVDSERKDVQVDVTWQQNAQRNGLVSLTSRLANWMVNVGVSWTTPSEESQIDVAGTNNGWKVQVQGDYAYVVRVSGTPDFLVVDISDTSSPSVVGSLNLLGGPRNIAVDGNYAYIASTNNSRELQIIDISTPASPSLTGTYNAPGNSDMYGVYVNGSTVYLSRNSSGQDELYIVNAAVPASPVLLGSLELGADANEVYVSGNYAYVASDSNAQELQVIDVSVPASPSLAASLNLSGNTNAEAVTGRDDLVIIGRSTNTGLMHTIDVSTPTSPTNLASYSATDDIRDVALDDTGDYVFLGTDLNSGEFQVIDISTLASPVLEGSVNVSGDLNGVAFYENEDSVVAVGDSNTDEVIIISP